jgi:hypothetical protein
MPITKANITLISPQPFVTESSVRNYSGIMTKGSNSIVLADESVIDGESLIVSLSGISQNEYSITNNTITFSEAVTEDTPYNVIIGIVLRRVSETVKDAPKFGASTYTNKTLAFTLNDNAGDIFYHTCVENMTININAGISNKMAVLVLVNGGNFTINWPSNIRWPGGVIPTLTTNGVDMIYLSKLNIPVGSDSSIIVASILRNLAKIA